MTSSPAATDSAATDPATTSPANVSDVLAVLGRGVVDPTTPVARADDAGLTRGDGCFEGARFVDGVVDKLDAHLARMARSAAGLGIAFDAGPWPALVAEAAAAWTGGEAAVKLLLTRGAPGADPVGLVMITPMPADYPGLRRDGLRVVTLARGLGAAAFEDAPWLLGGVKTLSYAINMAAAREAARRGAHDAIFLAADGSVLESTTGTVVWSVGRTLHTTPTGATGILASTTVARLFDRAADAGWSTSSTLGTVADLHAAEVVWLVSSVRGAIDVVELDGAVRERRPDVDAEVRRLAGF